MGVGRGSVVPLIFELEFGDGGWNVPRAVWIEGRILGGRRRGWWADGAEAFVGA